MSTRSLCFLLALLLCAGCRDPAPAETLGLDIEFAPCLGPVTSPGDAAVAPADCRAALDGHIQASTADARTHGCLVLAASGHPTERIRFTWEARRLVPVEGSRLALSAPIVQARFFLFSTPRRDCAGFDVDAVCAPDAGCLLSMEQEEIDLTMSGARIDFLRADRCQLTPSGLEPLQACVRCCAPGEEQTRTCRVCGAVPCMPQAEICDGIDNDCNGSIDDDVTDDEGPCRVGVGACAAVGENRCVRGELVCNALPGDAMVERCDEIDNDCDGTTDEGDGSEAEACETGELGICAIGRLSCTLGEFRCNRRDDPSDEVCDGLDNDCDGRADEEIEPAGCDTGQMGQCQLGQSTCQEGEAVCVATNGPADEACDELDNDCDGVSDEALDVTVMCTVGLGACATMGLIECRGGGSTGCNAVPLPPNEEICDGVDNDCDGASDEDIEADECDTGLSGPCQRGGSVCRLGELACQTLVRPSRELCDDIDNDCDGVLDEGFNVATVCTVGVGECTVRGVTQCTAEGGTECSAVAMPLNDEVCDGADNDCDGVSDEDIRAQECDTGFEEPCQVGRTICRNGEFVCAADAGPREEICDDLDNDCDGEVDTPAGATCCGGDEGAPPCNECPAGTRVPDGWACIPAGEFTMGSPDDEEGRVEPEGPQHRVTVGAPFLMMTTEVTQAQWTGVFDNGPSRNEGRDESCDQCPVETVNWWEAIAYANALSRGANLPECYQPQGCEGAAGVDLTCNRVLDVGFVGVACRGYRLPTEAEWEYAARAGTETRFWSGDAEADLARVGWYSANSPPDGDNDTRQTHPAGGKPANPWGLFDVHGNVFEWVYDWYAAAYDGADEQDPIGPEDGTNRGLRGGGCFSTAWDARSAVRGSNGPGARHRHVGFRLVLRLVLRPSP
jgi:formylglycine-generating enzyme required for sulfatase activity